MASGAKDATRKDAGGEESFEQSRAAAAAQTKARRGRFTSVSSMIDEDEADELETKMQDLSVVTEQQNRMENRSTTSFIFGVNNSITGLSHLLKVFESMNVNLLHIETRKSRNGASAFEIFVDVDVEKGIVNRLLMELRDKVESVLVQELSSESKSTQNSSAGDGQSKTTEHSSTVTVDKIPWFPRKIQDLDKVSKRVLMYGSELDADHPGFKDEVYRKRRNTFADIAFAYKQGDKISRIEYTRTEIETWGAVYRELMRLYPTHACKEFNENVPLLQKFCGYREDNIPQLEDVSNFLKDRTGFTLRPVAGYLSSRDFLAGLAFRVFNCTQYIRHSSDPFYTPEPDCCHELLGHVPLLADPSFAIFSQEIGLASLGASEEEVQKLATVYFFTVEFGLCKQEGNLRAYGAGLLSSIGELKHALSDKACIQAFDPKVVMKQECLVTTFQNSYFYSPSFDDAKEKMREFAKTIKRPFDVRYNPYTQTIEILDTPRSIVNVVNEMKGDLAIISNALKKLNDGSGQRIKRKCDGENGFKNNQTQKTS